MVFPAAPNRKWYEKAAKHHHVSSAASATTQPWPALLFGGGGVLLCFCPPSSLPRASSADNNAAPPPNLPGEAVSTPQPLNLVCVQPRVSSRLGALQASHFQSRGIPMGKWGNRGKKTKKQKTTNPSPEVHTDDSSCNKGGNGGINA